MTTKKTIRVPLAADGIPVVVDREELEKADGRLESSKTPPPGTGAAQGAPREVVEEEVTVPVHSSIESSLKFELLRRQSTDEEEEETKS